MSDNNFLSEERRANRSLLITMAVVVFAAFIVALFGFLFLNRPDDFIEGQVEGTTVRIAGKLPGRVAEFYVEEGDTIRAGDTLVCIHSALVEAQLVEAEAMREVARAQNRKADGGARRQVIQAAADLAAQAQAAVTITKKTFERVDNLYKQGVVSAQKRDEAKAAYDAAVAAADAAKSNYDLVKSGAQQEDKDAAAALVEAAGGSVAKVQSLLEDAYLTAPFDGTIDEIYPEEGELVSTGTPVMSLLRSDKRWITFNVREEMLSNIAVGTRIMVIVPALGMREIEVEVYNLRDRGTYAVWHSTKASGEWDSRTFEVKARPVGDVEGLRPGMSVIYEK